MSAPGRAAVFLDRDGVINLPVVRDGRPYPPPALADLKIYPDVTEACQKLKQAGFLLVVATNQPDVGRGGQEQSVVEAMHQVLCDALPIDRIEVCYHPGQGFDCPCRKPAPGMLIRASQDLGITLAKSYMVGDRWRDVDCGFRAGCRTIFVDRGYTEELRQTPDFVCGGLGEAAEIILKESSI